VDSAARVVLQAPAELADQPVPALMLPRIFLRTCQAAREARAVARAEPLVLVALQGRAAQVVRRARAVQSAPILMLPQILPPTCRAAPAA